MHEPVHAQLFNWLLAHNYHGARNPKRQSGARAPPCLAADLSGPFRRDPPDVEPGNLQRAYDDELRTNAGLIAGQFRKAIRNASWWVKHRDAVLGFFIGVVASLVASGIFWAFTRE